MGRFSGESFIYREYMHFNFPKNQKEKLIFRLSTGISTATE